jgi:DNA-binding transcriptional MerR regulator
MKIAELSRRSDVSIATIKYYIREGLLLPGAKSAPNQAQYTDEHLQRLRLIRVLRDVGGLSVETVKSLFEALADKADLHVAAMTHAGLKTTDLPVRRDAAWISAREELQTFLSGLGWQVFTDQPPFEHLVDVYVLLKGAWPPELGRYPFSVAALGPYAEAAHSVASAELRDETEVRKMPAEELLTWVVLGTLLFEPVLLALRRVAQQDVAATRWALGPA